MAKLIIDLSGQGGLLERHQGDLNSTSATPNLRYLGPDDALADGIYNPIKEYGFMNPAVNTYTTLTGTIATGINAIQYDPENDDLFFSEEGENILKLDGLADTSLTNYLSITSGDTIKDMEIYEVNGRRAICYVIDSGDTAYEIDQGTLTASTDDYFGGVGGMYVGFKMLDTDDDDVAYESLDGTGVAYTSASVTSNQTTIDDGTNHATKMAQPFSTDILLSNKLDVVALKLVRYTGTGAGITMQISIQATADRNTAPYSYQGAWTNSTAYSVNDTVLHNGVTFVCIAAHTSTAATDEPEVGSGTEDKWQRFGAPDGTAIATATVDATTIPDDSVLLTGLDATGDSNVQAMPFTLFKFSSDVSLSANSIYWIVLEESGSNMTSGDEIGWFSTVNNNAIYEPDTANGKYAKRYGPNPAGPGASNQWENHNANDQGQAESSEFKIGRRRVDDWSMNFASGHFIQQPGQETFLHKGDNGLLYWVTNNAIHSLDGSLTGGQTGRVSKNLIRFADYTNVVDLAETRGRMYIGVQTSDETTSSDDRTYTSNRAGMFVWDRRTQVLGSQDFFPVPSAKEIKSVFTTSKGDVKCITVSSTGFSEIRGLNNGQYQTIQTFEKDGYPQSRRGVTRMDGLTTWLGANGILYGYGSVVPGSPERLYKLADMSAEANAGLTTGPIYLGHEEASEPRLGMFMAWTDSDPSYIVQKWFPNGDGTIGSDAQKANPGNVYSKVFSLPSFSTLRYMNLLFAPGTNTGATEIADLKCYYNMSTTPAWSKTLTQDDIVRGFLEKEINKPNINHVQFEIEWKTAPTLGVDTFRPMYIELDYDDESRING